MVAGWNGRSGTGQQNSLSGYIYIGQGYISGARSGSGDF